MNQNLFTERTPRERLISLQKKCEKHKHTLRTNKYGVTWCIGCGLLSSSIGEPLKNEDKIIIVC